MADSPKAAPKAAKASTRAESWENEGGSLTPEQAAIELGVVRTMTETFSVGGYRYTNLMHAISEARRLRDTGKRYDGACAIRPDYLGFFLPLVAMAAAIWFFVK